RAAPRPVPRRARAPVGLRRAGRGRVAARGLRLGRAHPPGHPPGCHARARPARRRRHDGGRRAGHGPAVPAGPRRPARPPPVARTAVGPARLYLGVEFPSDGPGAWAAARAWVIGLRLILAAPRPRVWRRAARPAATHVDGGGGSPMSAPGDATNAPRFERAAL